MEGQIARRDVIKAVGSATIWASTASIVSAESDGSPNSYRLPDLSVRSFLEESQDVEFRIEDQITDTPLATRRITVDHAQDGKLPGPQSFNFVIPRGRFRLTVVWEEDVLAEETFAAPIGGFPDHRGFVAEFDQGSFELYEQYI